MNLNAVRAGCLLALLYHLVPAAFSQALTTPTGTAQQTSYDDFITSGRIALKEQRLAEARNSAKAAIKAIDGRYEGYALAALVAKEEGDVEQAKRCVNQALERAPENRKEKLREFEKSLSTETVPDASQLSGEARRKYDALLLIIEDADKAKSADERKSLLQEFMSKSAEFLPLAPLQTNIVVLRAAAALELDYPGTGWLVGRRLKELVLDNSDDSKVRKVLAGLERKGWLGIDHPWRDWSKWTMEQITVSAANGESESQEALGDYYQTGRNGLSINLSEAVKWYRKAAEQGNADGQYNLGDMYANGSGVVKDEAEAVKWYRKSAEQGNANGQCNVGSMYANGSGVVKDEAEAVKWYRKSAEQGNAYGQYNLGLMYANGRGVAKDDVEAVKWYRKAAEQGHANGQCNLGAMYDNGSGVVKDVAEAVKWYRKSAEQGNAYGQYGLAVSYENGNGVVKDEGEAVKWFRKAAEQGMEKAKKALEDKEKLAAPAQKVQTAVTQPASEYPPADPVFVFKQILIFCGLIFFLGVLYFVPAINGLQRKHRKRRSIFLCNLLLGWTIVGWLFALGWCLTGDVETVPPKIPE